MVGIIKRIFKRADPHIKTVEAWTAFGVLVMSSGVTAAILKVIKDAVFSVSWEYWVIVGVPTLIVLTFCGQYYSFRRKKNQLLLMNLQNGEALSSDETPVTTTANLDYSKPIEDLERKVDRLIDFQVERDVSIKSLSEAMIASAQTSDLEQLETKIERLNGTMDGKFALQDKSISALSAEVSELSRIIDDEYKRNRLRFGELHEILQAKTYLNRFDVMTADIESLIADLDVLPMCKNWESLYTAFKGKLREWDTFKDIYPIPAYKPLFEVNEQDLKLKGWTPKVQALDPDQALSYKHFRIYKRAFEENKDRLHSKILDKAMQFFIGSGCSSESLDYFN